MSRSPFIAALAILATLALLVPSLAEDTGHCDFSVLGRPLSKVEALNLAIAHNSTILKARKDAEAAIGVSIQTKAIIYPTVTGTANYRARQDTLIEQTTVPKKSATIPSQDLPVIAADGTPVVPEETVEVPGRALSVGGEPLPKNNNQDWDAQIRVVQSLYEGGRLLSAVRSSRLIRERALFVYQSTVADVMLSVSTAYDDVLNTAKQIEVRRSSVELLTRFARDTRIRGEVGDRPEFDVLRAEVELANEEAELVRAIGAHRVAKQVFVEQLGYDLSVTVSDDLPLCLTTPLRAWCYPKTLPEALTQAIQCRSEVAARDTEVKLGNENIIVAKAGLKPSVQALGGYQLTSRVQARNPGDPLYGAFVGAQVSVPIFDGFLTKGRVIEAVALRDRACESKAETARLVELEVRTAWSDLRTATAILEAQTQNLAKAAKALTLVEARYKEGDAPEVAVLSAQTALTNARTTYFQALRDYSVARARMLHATGEIIQPAVVK